MTHEIPDVETTTMWVPGDHPFVEMFRAYPPTINESVLIVLEGSFGSSDVIVRVRALRYEDRKPRNILPTFEQDGQSHSPTYIAPAEGQTAADVLRALADALDVASS